MWNIDMFVFIYFSPQDTVSFHGTKEEFRKGQGKKQKWSLLNTCFNYYFLISQVYNVVPESTPTPTAVVAASAN